MTGVPLLYKFIQVAQYKFIKIYKSAMTSILFTHTIQPFISKVSIMEIIRFFCLTLFVFVFSFHANASKILLQTNYGDIEIELFDQITPITVENFLQYVNNQGYDDILIHRLIPNFIFQSGGYHLDENELAVKTPNYGVILNEPFLSNVKGTIAMAKLGGDPHSATSEWFINLVNNSDNLDIQNAGFTVFGQVTENSFAVLDAISTINTFNFDNPFNALPLDNYTITYDDNEKVIPPTTDQFVSINSISITNSDPESSNHLSPTRNTLIESKNKSSAAGSLAIWMLIITFVSIGFRHGSAYK